MGAKVQGSKVHILAQVTGRRGGHGERIDDWYAAAGARAMSQIQRGAIEFKSYNGTSWKSHFNDGSW